MLAAQRRLTTRLQKDKNRRAKERELAERNAPDPSLLERKYVKRVQYRLSTRSFQVWREGCDGPTEHRSRNLHETVPKHLLAQAYKVERLLHPKDEKDQEYEVTKIRYNLPSKLFTVWWAGWTTPSVDVPRSDLTNVESVRVKCAVCNPGLTVELKGARCDETTETLVPVTPCLHGGLLVGRKLYQATDKFCCLNSVANTGNLTKPLYDLIKEKGPIFSMKEIAFLLNSTKGSRGYLTRVKMATPNINQLLVHVLKQKGEVFCVVVNEAHCITIDTRQERRVILDTDPKFPQPLELTWKNLKMLGYTRFDAVYKWVDRPVSKKNKRKRKRQEDLM